MYESVPIHHLTSLREVLRGPIASHPAAQQGRVSEGAGHVAMTADLGIREELEGDT
jgi:hypothetical protein